MSTYCRGIIVEGCDCSGKSSLVKALKIELSEFGWDVRDLGHKSGCQFIRYAREYCLADGVIFDRGHFSEVVYGTLWRKGVHFTPWELALLDYIAKTEFIVILTTAHASDLLKRYSEREHRQVICSDELTTTQNLFIQTMSANQELIQYEATNQTALMNTVGTVRSLIERRMNLAPILKTAPDRGPDMKTFVVLEGANGSGKSTLAKLLKVNLVGWSVTTLDYSPSTPSFNQYLTSYSFAQSTIFDRGHFSELVYGDMFRNGQHFSDLELQHLNAFTLERAIVILCEPSLSTLQQRVANTRYPKHIDVARLEEVRQRFRRVLDDSGLHYRVVQTDDPDAIDRVVASVAKELSGTPYTAMGWNAPRKADPTL
jgi:thymidylate kinase